VRFARKENKMKPIVRQKLFRLRAKGHNSEYIAHELGYTPQWIREKLKQFREMSDEDFDKLYQKEGGLEE